MGKQDRRIAIARRCAAFGLVALLAALGGASPALAGGLILYEINSPSTGTASAGWSALGQDASTAFMNPAAMTRLDSPALLGGLEILVVSSEFDSDSDTSVPGTGGDGGDAGVPTPSLGGYYVHPVADRFRVGIAATSFFGLGLDYGHRWVGRYISQQGEFLTLAVLATGAWEVTDWLSIGGGVGPVYGRFEAKAAILNGEDPGNDDGQLRYDDDDVSVLGNVGVFLEPLEQVRFGVTYYSPVDLDFRDRALLSNVGPITQAIIDLSGAAGQPLKLDFTLPQWVMASIVWEPTEDLALMLNGGWQDWSEFGQIDVNLESVLDRSIDANYDDTWHIAFGVQYRVAEPWLLMAGFAYDSSPVNKSNRSVALPLDRTYRYAVGAQYDWNEHLTLGLSYEFIDTGSADISQSRPLTGTVRGDYSPNYINVVSATVAWKF